MKRLFFTPLVRYALSIGALALLVAWIHQCTAPQRRAQEVWLSHERVISDVAAGKPGSLTEYQDTYYFFHELTGITIPSNYSSYLGPMPNDASGMVIEELRRWYSENRDRLYWDEEHEKVRLAPAAN